MREINLKNFRNCAVFKLYFKIIFLIFVSSAYSQVRFNESEFLYRVRTIYHSLRSSGLINFSSWVTSNIFLDETKDIFNQEIFPIEIIWTNANLIYYIKRPIPDIDKENTLEVVKKLQMDMLEELKGLLIDWQRFAAGNILDNMPETYLITSENDTAFIRFEKYEDGRNLKINMLFGVNGLCMKIINEYPDTGEKIFIYPGYLLIDDKWLLNKWTVQILKDDQVESGFFVELENKKMDNYWIPQRMILQLKKKGLEDKWFIREYKFKNIILNKDLKIVP